MAITKILARKGRLDVGIRYVLNGDKTQEQILTARLNCDPGHECRKTQNSLPRMEQEIDKAEARESEVRTNEHRRR